MASRSSTLVSSCRINGIWGSSLCDVQALQKLPQHAASTSAEHSPTVRCSATSLWAVACLNMSWLGPSVGTCVVLNWLLETVWFHTWIPQIDSLEDYCTGLHSENVPSTKLLLGLHSRPLSREL